jgi:hypothetical protein
MLFWRPVMCQKDYPMSIFVLDLILSAVMIGLLVYLVIASTPPKHC